MRIYLKRSDYMIGKESDYGLEYDSDRGEWYFYEKKGRLPDNLGWCEILPSVKPKASKSRKVKNGRTYIKVPYKNHNEARELGAKFDSLVKSWYVVGKYNIKLDRFPTWYPSVKIKERKEAIDRFSKEFKKIMKIIS